MNRTGDMYMNGSLWRSSRPPATRRAWAALFEHYVFAAPDDAVRLLATAPRINRPLCAIIW
jgi:hypothetical protein